MIKKMKWLCSRLLLLFLVMICAPAMAATTWQQTGGPTEVTSIAIDPTRSQTIYTGTAYNGVYKSFDGGSTWSTFNSGLTNVGVSLSSLAIDPTSPQTVYVGINNSGVFKSTNGGVSWSAANNGLPTGMGVTSLALDPVSPQTVYATGTGFSGVYKSTNGGGSWSSRNNGLPNIPYTYSLAIDPTSPQTVYAGTDHGVFKSTDGGGSWSTINNGVTYNIYTDPIRCLAIDPTNSQTVYAGTKSGVFKSISGGGPWSMVNIGQTSTFAMSLAIDPTSPQTVYAGTSDGVYKSTNGGGSWSPISGGLTSTYVMSLTIDPTSHQTVLVGTSQGMFKGLSIMDAPTISGIPAATASVGTLYDFIPSSIDAVSFNIAGSIPPGLNFSSITGSLSGTPTAAGIYSNIVINAINSIGTVSLPAFTVTIADLIAPVVTAFTIPATSVSLSVPISGLTATDNLAITGYMLTESSAAPTATADGWSTTKPTIYTFTTGGAKILFVWAKDAAGNVSLSKSANVVITTISGIPATTAAVGTYYSFTPSSTSASNFSISGIIPSGLNFNSTNGMLSGTPTTVGTYDNIVISANISSGTVSLPAFTITVTLPMLTISGTPPTTNTVGTAYSFTPTSTNAATFSITGSLPQGLSFNTTTGTISGIPTTVGTYNNIIIIASNTSGSAALPAFTITILPDIISPIVTAFTLPKTSSSLTIAISSFAASDNVAVTGYLLTETSSAPIASDVGWNATKPTSYTFINSGAKTLFAWAKDAGSNVSLSKSANFVVTLPDTTVPVVTVLTIPATSTNLIVPISTLTATDNIAVTGYLLTETSSVPTATATGWRATKPASYTFTTDGSKTLYAWAKDAVGNISASMSATVTVDTTGPTLTLSTLSDGAITKDATLNISGTVSDTSSIDSLSINNTAVTITNDSFSYPVTLQAGANTITTIITDTLGNSTTDTRIITLDITAPVLTISAPADNSKTAQALATITGTVSETSTVTITVNTGTLQSASITGSGYSATVNLVSGINTIDITATDLAGNTSTAKRTITYDNTAPSLSVSSPAQDISTAQGSIAISGSVADTITSATISITADGVTYTPTANQDGSFSQDIQLPTDKTYAVVVTATDQATNSVTVQRNIIKSTPLTQPTINDALKVLQAVVGITPLTASEQIRYDVAPLSANGTPVGNGAIDAADVILILRRSIGIGSW